MPRCVSGDARFHATTTMIENHGIHGGISKTVVRAGAGTVWLFILLAVSGCADPPGGPVVFYLEGAGWYSSAGSVKAGLQKAGYTGKFQTHTWSAFLGPAHDHFVTARSKAVAHGLARKIQKARAKDPDGRIILMGLSAGTAVILSALEQLPEGVQVDSVVLFSPTVSAEHNLTKVMQRVRGNLYATCSSRDAIAGTLVVNADGKSGPPAGRAGFRMTARGEKAEAAYHRVVNIPWEPTHTAFDWSGTHTGVTTSNFVASVIAPRILHDEPFPLDRSVADRTLARVKGDRS